MVYNTLIRLAAYDFPLPGGPLIIIAIFNGLLVRVGGYKSSLTVVKFGLFGISIVSGKLSNLFLSVS